MDGSDAERWVASTDPIELAEIAMRQLPREAVLRAQIDVVLWGLSTVPIGRKDLPREGAEEWRETMSALAAMLADAPCSRTVAQRFRAWVDRTISDWATNEALSELSILVHDLVYAHTSALETGTCDVDLDGAVYGVIRAVGLWEWDEMLAEEAGFGTRIDEHDAQIARQEDIRFAAKRVLCDLLRHRLGDLATASSGL